MVLISHLIIIRFIGRFHFPKILQFDEEKIPKPYTVHDRSTWKRDNLTIIFKNFSAVVYNHGVILMFCFVRCDWKRNKKKFCPGKKNWFLCQLTDFITYQNRLHFDKKIRTHLQIAFSVYIWPPYHV